VINQTAAGAFLADPTAYTAITGATSATVVGSASTTCSNWTNSGGIAETGVADTVIPGEFWAQNGAGCAALTPLLCLQQ